MLCIESLLSSNGRISGPVYIMPFSYEDGIEILSYENGIV